MSFAATAVRHPVNRISAQTLLLASCAVAAAVVVGVFGLQSRQEGVHEALPVLLIPVALWLFFSERYEVTLAVLLLYLGLLDGVIKLSSGSSVATLGRDALLYAITLGAVARMMLRKSALSVPPFAGLVFAWVAVCVMQLANPSGISFLHGVASLRQHLEFVPLFFFGYVVLRSERRVAGLLLLLVVAAAVNGVVGLLQSRMSPTQLASWGPGYTGLVFGTSTRIARVFVTAAHQAAVRPPGLGGTDGFGGMVGLIAVPGAAALLSGAYRWRTKMRWFVIPGALLAVLGVVTSQSRLALVGAVIALLAFLGLTLVSRRGLIALLVTILVAVAGYFVVSAFVSSGPSRYSTLAPSKVVNTAVNARQSSLVLIPRYLAAYPLGAGLGSVGPAAGAGIGGSALGRDLNGETQFTFLLVETGIPGLLVMLGFTVVTVRAGLMLRRVTDVGLQRSLMALTAVLIALLAAWFIASTTADSPSSPFLWLGGGCIAYWYGELRAGRLPVRTHRIRESLARR